MLKLIIQDDEGRQRTIPFTEGELTVGRAADNAVRLEERNVSRRHLRLTREADGSVRVEDLGSSYGTRVNGARLSGPALLAPGDVVQVGDFSLQVAPEAGAQPDPRLVETAVIHPADAATVPGLPVLPLAAEQAPRLVAEDGDLAGHEWRLTQTDVRLGRAEECEVAIDHRSLSRAHARLVRGASGDWHLLDLGSANGVRVNGEPYARVPLRSGDVLELGHVRLRFELPGGALPPPAAAPGRRRAWLALGLGGLALLGGTAVVVVGQAPGAQSAPVEMAPVVLEPSATAPAAPAPAPMPPPWAPALEAAREALAARELDRAAALLENVPDTDGHRPGDVELLLDEVRGELVVQKNLALARRALATGRLAQAEQLLLDSAGTRVWADESSRLTAQLATRRRKAGKAPPRAVALATRARAQLLSHHLEDAEATLHQCLAADPAAATCHLLLGTTYAQLQQPEQGAFHYRRFLELAPGHPDAATVRKHLDNYERSRAPRP